MIHLLLAGSLTACPRRRHDWRGAFSLYGPLIPLALAAGLIAGTALALWRMG